MPKQLNVNMAFTADTSQAKKQLQDLQKALTNLTTNAYSSKNGLKVVDVKNIQEASAAIAKLKVDLQEATNKNTGALDLSKFQESMDRSGMSLEKYRDQLFKLGPAGQKAFSALTDSILMSEVPLKRTNALVDQLWTALKNTARWQLSSSALHGFIGAVQGAYGYAQDLNKSLNSIRIVTGQSTDEMAELATEANKTAQALSTSTLAYTDAALIYYQQGLSDDQVAERVSTTLKMSNVTGESAEEVSSYMTAIWNNFRKGGESLESFADKITALGAATASSSREIAGGLQQFAAIADTVGLSYDYAATALATVVAQTRQSESTVGNSFRTIFSRLEGLQLGETLEDGTDLNKYSGALATIGVNIKDQNGELKQMDTILEEIGARWQTLSRDQQVALAQTVGGVRQYTNLIALFDNWDTFQRNLAVSMNAEGTLDEQAKIYAESWEAAQKRVKTAAQAIYQSLIDEDFFIGVANLTEDLLNQVNSIIEAFGGLKGVLSSVIALILQLKGAEIGQGITDALYNLQPTAVKELNALRLKEAAVQANTITEPEDAASTFAKIQSETLNDYKKIQMEILYNSDNLTEQDKKQLTILLDQNRALQENAQERAKMIDQAQQEAEIASIDILASAKKSGTYRDALEAMSGSFDMELDGKSYGFDRDVGSELKAQYEAYLNCAKGSNEYKNAIDEITDIQMYFTEVLGVSKDVWEKYSDAMLRQAQAEKELRDAMGALGSSTEGLSAKINAASIVLKPVGENIVNIARSLASLTTAINAFRGIWQTIQNPDLSIWEKLLAIIPALSMALTALTRVKLKENLEDAKAILIKTAEAVVRAKNANIELAEVKAKGANIVATQAETAVTEEDIAIQTMDTAAKEGNTVATLGLAGAIDVLLGPLLLVIAAIATLAVGIAVLDKAILTDKERMEESGKALEKMNDELDRATDSANKAREAYDNLSNIFDKLSDKDKIFEGLKKGTQEWAEAIADTNKELLDNLKATGELQNAKLSYDNDGLITVDNQEEILSNAKDTSYLADMREYGTKISQIEASLDNSIKSLANDLDESFGSFPTREDLITGLSQELLSAGYGNYSSEELLNAFENIQENPEIDNKLSEIATKFPEVFNLNNKELIDTVVKAADKIAGSNTESDAFKAEQGRRFAEHNNLDIPEYAQAETYKAIGDLLASDDLNAEAANRLKPKGAVYGQSRGTKVASDADMQTYAELTEGVTYDNGKLLDSLGKDITDEISAAYIAKVALLNEKLQNADIDLNTPEVQAAIAEGEKTVLKRITDQFGNSPALSSLNEDQLTAINGLSDEQLSNFKTLGELLEYIDVVAQDVNHHLEFDAEDLTHFKGKTEDLAEEINTLSSYLKDNVDNISDLDKSIKYCQEGLDALAYSMIRFDDALQDVEDNYEDWKKALDSDDLYQKAKATKELSKTYANLLDMDASDFSNSFLESADNLELLNTVLDGTEEEAVAAYDQLARLAEVSYVKMHLDMDDTEATNIVNRIESLKDQIGYDDIQIHASIEDSGVIAGLESIINSVDMTVEQAEALLANMGFDAEVKKEDVPEEEKRRIIDLRPEVTDGPAMNIPTVAADGSVDYNTVHAPRLQYIPEPHETEETSTKQVSALKIKSLKKGAKASGGGNIKVQNSPARSNHAANKGSGSGGGGGGSKKKTVKEHTKTVKNEDRYHDIKERIDDLNKSLTRLGKTEDRIYGKAKLKYMDMEIEKLEDQIKLTDEYIAEIKKYAAIDQANLRGIGMGAEFDENGMLTNYEQVLANITNSYNAAIGAYNGAIDAFNGSAQEEGDNEALDGAKKQLDAAKETYDENQKILKQYEDTFNLLQEQVDKRIDQVWALFDMRLKKITFEVEFEINWNERELKYLDWLLENIGDTADKGVDKIANLAQQMNEYADTIDWAKKGIQGIFGLHGINFDFDNADPVALTDQLTDAMHRLNFESQLTEDEANALLDYCDTLMEAIDGIRDKWKAAHEAVNDTWDKWNERLERETDRLENYAKEMQSIQNIIDLTGRNMLNLSTDDLSKMSQSQIENNWAQVESWKAIMEARKASMEEARYYMENGETEEIREEWRKSFEQFEDDYNNAHQNYYSAWEDTLEMVQDAFEKTMDNLGKDYNKAMGDLTLIQEQFARKQEINHLYLDDYEKYHELNKSVDELRKSLENTNSTMMKSKMNDLLDEMNASMRDGVNISEAQAEIYARRVALLQAEAELLDAQNAKSAVRMTRDNEGNFSYTYTADQDQIDDAETNYQDKFYEVLSYERQYMEDIQGQMLDMTEQFWSDYYDLCERYKDDSAALEEAVEALIDDYNIKMDFLVAEQEMDMDEMARLRDEDWKDFEDLTNKKLANQDDFIADFRSTIVGGLYPQYQTANQYAIEWQKTVERTTQAGNKAVDLYQTNTQHTFEVAGQNIDTYGQRAVNKMNDIANQSQDTKQKVTDMAGEMQIDMNAIMSTAWSLDSTWGTVMNNMRSQIQQTVSALYQLLQRLQEVQAQAQATIAACAAAAQAQAAAAYGGGGGAGGGGGSGSGGGGGGGGGGGTPTLVGNKVVSPTANGQWYETLYYSDGSSETRRTGSSFNNKVGKEKGSFDTGGYTGAWGPEGKLAMLHEKELVLNKEDTSNILGVVDSVRDLISNFGRNALNNLANAITNSGSLAMAGAGTLDQNVHIEASFPNVQSHTEIELALNNLINSASQYVNRK